MHPHGALLGDRLMEQRFGDRLHRRLAGGVDGLVGVDQEGAVGRTGNDEVRFAVLVHQAGHEGGDGVHHAPEVHLETPLPVVLGVAPQGTRLAGGDTGVGEDEVRAAEFVEGEGGQIVEARWIGDVAPPGVCRRTARPQRVPCLCKRRLVDVRDEHARARIGEGEGQRAPDPARASGDDGQLVREVLHVGLLRTTRAGPADRPVRRESASRPGCRRTARSPRDPARRPG